MIAQNNNPLNQLAKQLLEDAKEEVSPDHLYGLQLVEWMLTNHPKALPGPEQQFAPELLENVQQMYQWPHKEAMRELVNQEEPGSYLEAARNLAYQLKGQPIKHAAATMVELLWINLQKSAPGLMAS